MTATAPGMIVRRVVILRLRCNGGTHRCRGAARARQRREPIAQAVGIEHYSLRSAIITNLRLSAE